MKKVPFVTLDKLQEIYEKTMALQKEKANVRYYVETDPAVHLPEAGDGLSAGQGKRDRHEAVRSGYAYLDNY